MSKAWGLKRQAQRLTAPNYDIQGGLLLQASAARERLFRLEAYWAGFSYQPHWHMAAIVTLGYHSKQEQRAATFSSKQHLLV